MLNSAGVTGAEFRALLAVFRDGQRALGEGRIAEATARLSEASRARPTSGAAAVALAAVQAAANDLPAAELSLARATRLRPGDAELGELHRRVTEVSRGATPAETSRVTAAPPKVGAVLDGWRLELLLGRGGWGQVFKAMRDGEERALKVMHPQLSSDAAFVERFKSEILTLAGLRGHKNLVEIHGFGKDADCWYFLMEFIKGLSLDQYLMKNGPLTAKQALALFTRLADGLAVAHARGVVHRDIKPGNIMLRAPNGVPVLVDFGLASAGDGAGLTRTGQSAGYTPMFAAPEQLRGKSADARSDVYALAAALFYTLNYDKPALREPDQYEPEHAPEALREALTRALHPKPERRYANAVEFRAALAASTNLPGRGDVAPDEAAPCAGQVRASLPPSKQGRDTSSILAVASDSVTLSVSAGTQQALLKDRDAFLQAVQEYTSVEVRDRYAHVLDDLIRWTQRQGAAVQFRPRGDRTQATVTYCLAGDNTTFWTAYPRKKDGAKLSVLDSKGSRVPEEVRDALRQAFARLEGGASSLPDSYPTLSFRALGTEKLLNELHRCLGNTLAALGRITR